MRTSRSRWSAIHFTVALAAAGLVAAIAALPSLAQAPAPSPAPMAGMMSGQGMPAMHGHGASGSTMAAMAGMAEHHASMPEDLQAVMASHHAASGAVGMGAMMPMMMGGQGAGHPAITAEQQALMQAHHATMPGELRSAMASMHGAAGMPANCPALDTSGS